MIRGDQSSEIKKKIMFIKEEDYNYLAYNIFIILSFFKCNSDSKPLKDFKKLSYLISLISNEKYIIALSKRINNINLEDYEMQILNELYYDSKLKHRGIASLLLALERKNYIYLIKNKSTMDIWVNDEFALKFIENKDMFGEEIRNCEKLRDMFSRLRTNSNETLEKIIFNKDGGNLWDI